MPMTKTDPIKIILADDHPIVREGIRARLSTQPNMKIVAEAENGNEAIKRVQEFAPATDKETLGKLGSAGRCHVCSRRGSKSKGPLPYSRKG